MNNWFSCELHCHTVNSDGDFTVKELMKTAKERKLDGICLTDHNTMSGWNETEKYDGPVVLKGIEWTTYFGHMLVLDAQKYVDWRNALPDTIDEKMKEVHENGGIVGIAHPFQLGTPICTGGHWDYNVRNYNLVNYMEIWSEGMPMMNTANRRALSLWQSLLDKGYKITPTFGRDWHSAVNNVYPGACTYLCSPSKELTDKDIKNAIIGGKTVLSTGVLFYFETENGETSGDTISGGETELSFVTDDSRLKSLSCENKFTPRKIKFISNGGKEIFEIFCDRSVVKKSVFLEKNRYYRAELWGEIDDRKDCLLALTAPVYIEI